MNGNLLLPCPLPYLPVIGSAQTMSHRAQGPTASNATCAASAGGCPAAAPTSLLPFRALAAMSGIAAAGAAAVTSRPRQLSSACGSVPAITTLGLRQAAGRRCCLGGSILLAKHPAHDAHAHAASRRPGRSLPLNSPSLPPAERT